MKRFLLVLPILGVAACASQHPASPTTTAVYPDDVLPGDIREPSRVHTYLVNDYIDPNNPRVLHRGHAVEVVEQDDRWNLDSTDSPEDNGRNTVPTTPTADSNATPNPYSAEFETELSQQRDQYKQLAGLGSQMTAEMARLEDLASKEADAVSENAALRTRLEGLQREIDELKPQPPTPVNPNAPKSPSWWPSIFDLFRQLPDGAPVAVEKPKLRAPVALQPVPPPARSTNAPDEMPSPGEMAQPQDSNTQ